MDKLKAIEILNKRREESEKLKNSKSGSPQFTKWHSDTCVAIKNIFGENANWLKKFDDNHYNPSITVTPDSEFERLCYHRGLGRAEALLSSMIDEINEYGLNQTDIPASSPDALAVIDKLCNRFHNAAKQLRQRRNDRNTLDVKDEYDVQDLFHALLMLYFDDIRDEECTPSNAGNSSRIDFLLDSNQIGIELKMTRKNLGTKEVKEQLLIDIANYKKHPKCNHLICFVYDPESWIKNPRGFEKDLSQTGDNPVTVYVRPN